jgi:hypothetical protein
VIDSEEVDDEMKKIESKMTAVNRTADGRSLCLSVEVSEDSHEDYVWCWAIDWIQLSLTNETFSCTVDALQK